MHPRTVKFSFAGRRGLAAAFVASLAAAPACVRIEFNDGPRTVSRAFDHRVPAENVGVIDLAARRGSITLTRDPSAAEISIRGTRRATAPSSDEAGFAVELIDIDVRVAESDPVQVFVQFEAPPDSALTAYEADFIIVSPVGVEFRVEQEEGDVTVSGNTGPLQIDVFGGGDISITEQSGEVEAATRTGHVTVHSGGGSVNASTGDGRIVVTARGSVDASNTNGSITIGASPEPGGAVFARSLSGDVSVKVPSDFGTELRLATAFGEITTQLEGFDIDEIHLDVNEITATLNGGGGDVRAETQFGDVTFGPR